MSAKRRRDEGGARDPRARAAAIGARMNAKYPRNDWSIQYHPVGQNIDAYGTTWRQASREQRAARKAANFYGKGAYGRRYRGRGGFWSDRWDDIKSIGKKVAKPLLGTAIKTLVPGGDMVSKAIGLGRYDMAGLGSYGPAVQNNAIVHGGGGDGMDVATVNPTMDDDSGDIIVSHKEFVRNVVVKGTQGKQSGFAIDALPINPGLQETFPFMSQIAQNFTMYSMEGLIFTFKPLSGEGGGSTNQLGKVILATDYDPAAKPFINSVQMENYQYSQSTKPSLGMQHGVECKKTQSITEMNYIRTGASTRDKAFTDIGLFQIATEGIPVGGPVGQESTMIIGEIWASYRVRLSRANLYSSLLGYNIRMNIARYATAAHATLGAKLPVSGEENYFKNLNLKIKFYNPVTAVGGNVIKFEWDPNVILGVYRIKIHKSFTNLAGASMPALNNGVQCIGDIMTAQSTAGEYDVKQGEYLTQYGSTFLPYEQQGMGTSYKPTLDNETGAMTNPEDWATVHGGAVWSEATLGVGQMSWETYFAINAPGINVPRLVFQEQSGWAGNPPSFSNNSFNVYSGVNSSSDYHITVDLVNAEISNFD